MRKIALTLLCLLIAACGGQIEAPVEPADPAQSGIFVAADIVEARAQFARTVLDADLSHLSDGDRAALDHLIAAARVMREIFELQAWAGNADFKDEIAGIEGAAGDAVRDYYRIMIGPWDRLVGHEAFVGDRVWPKGAGYYPEDMSREEFEAWIAEHPDDEEAFKSLHTVIRRGSEGGLMAIPYSEFYGEQLGRAAEHLRAAAAATDDPTLEDFLVKRADAFATDDYYESDFAWMDLAGSLEVVVGPYETYEDQIFGFKAAFESFVCVEIPEESAKLEIYKAKLPMLERNLPIPDEHKNLDRGSESPIRVVDEVFVDGDTRSGIQTIAFNLPNDERVREAKGSKKVMLRNIMRAKYDKILLPIAAKVLDAEDAAKVDWKAYFDFILHHELSHGLGPGRIVVDGRETEVRLELEELYSAFEEAKADVLGVYDLYQLVDDGTVDAAVLEHLPATFTAGLFRSARFGTTEAHGLGVVLQVNAMIELGAIVITDEGKFKPVTEKFRAGITSLATELIMVQAYGDKAAAEAMKAARGTVPAAMQALLDDMSEIPVDIDPVYPHAGETL